MATTKAPKMTELEQKLLTAVWFSEYHDGAYPVDHAVWTNCATETLGKSAQGAITSAKKKGWIFSQGDTTEDRVIWVTAAGAKALAERMPSVEFQVQKHKEQNARDVAAAVGPAPVLADPKMERLRRMVAETPNEGEPTKPAREASATWAARVDRKDGLVCRATDEFSSVPCEGDRFEVVKLPSGRIVLFCVLCGEVQDLAAAIA